MDETIENPTARLKPIFDETFKFKIGQAVAFANAVAKYDAECDINEGIEQKYRGSSRYGSPPPMYITSRWLEECHGGVQMHYGMSCSVDVKSSSQVLVKVFEFELVDYKDAVDAARRLQLQANSKTEKEE